MNDIISLDNKYGRHIVYPYNELFFLPLFVCFGVSNTLYACYTAPWYRCWLHPSTGGVCYRFSCVIMLLLCILIPYFTIYMYNIVKKNLHTPSPQILVADIQNIFKGEGGRVQPKFIPFLSEFPGTKTSK